MLQTEALKINNCEKKWKEVVVKLNNKNRLV